jgi:exopolysaccharide biosynthesis polyprenyl glycosylphosphotransferase
VRSGPNGHSTSEGLRQFGALSPNDLAQVIRDQRIERLVVAADDVGDDEMLAILQQARAQALKVSLLPDYVHAMGPAMQIGDVEGITLLDLNPLVLARSSRLLKRAIDVACSALALILFAPLMALIALAVKLDSPGPAFFRQVRVGRRGKEFRLLKFRTMTVDAEDRVEELWALSQDPNWLHLEHDPRITRLGRILRLTSLDELPQLWNVLRGEMSLVGPRPLAKREDSRVCGWERTRLDLAPGLTGPWQVMGRTQIPFEEMTKLDYLYVTNWSLWTDVKLIMQTLPVVLNRKGAN